MSAQYCLMKVKPDSVCDKATLSAAFSPRRNGGLSTGGLIMNRQQVEHVLRAAGSITECREMVVLGSQSILGSLPDPPASLLVSMELDLYPLHDPEKADLIDGCIGELSPFHQTFGYYGHGVGPGTAVLPKNWNKRLVRLENINTGGTIGWCLSPHDLAVSKLLAGREKDIEFVRVLLQNNLISDSFLREMAAELSNQHAALLAQRLLLCR